VRFGLMFLFAQRVWPITYQWQPIILLLGWGCVATAAYHAIAPETIAAQLVMATTIGAVYVGGAFALGVSQAERSRLRSSILALTRRYRAVQPS